MIFSALLLASSLPTVSTAEFPGGAANAISVMVASICIDQGWAITTQSDNQVVCERKPDGLSALKYLGEAPRRGASQLKGFVRFIVLPRGDKVRVQISGYSEYSTAFGQVRQIPLQLFDDLEALVEKAGGTIAR